MLPTRQQSAAPACSGCCGAAAPPPRPVHGAGERRHGLPPAAGGAHFPKEAQDAPAVYAALCSAAHGPRHTKPTLSLAKRLSAEGLAARTRLLRGHALRPGERGAGTPPFLESVSPIRGFFGQGVYSMLCTLAVREAPPGHQMGPPGGLRAPAEATLVVPRHPPDSCCAALACVAADGGTPCAAAPQSRHCRRHTCPQMRRVPVRPRQTGLVADRQPALCLRRRPASRIVVTFRRPTSRASGRVLDDGHAQLTGLVA